jgi:hypothetical protein
MARKPGVPKEEELAENALSVPENAKSEIEQVEAPRIPSFRRDIKPEKIVLSANDLKEFSELIISVNVGAKRIEYNNINPNNFESPAAAMKTVEDLMLIEYNYQSRSGDRVQGLGVPVTEDRTFPEDLASFFISNASYAERAVDSRPLNTVEVFLGFDKPSMKIDLLTFPSNPTENRSIINIQGRDEDWVRSTTEKINEFFRTKRVWRPILHASGTYDYFIYLLYIPAIIWGIFVFKDSSASAWLQQQSVFLNVVIGVYSILISLLFGRFIFQYFRWLFPPIEFYKKSRIGAYLHRAIFGILATSTFIAGFYDLFKWILVYLFWS